MLTDYVAYIAVLVFYPIVDILVCIPVIHVCIVVIIEFLVGFNKKVSVPLKPAASFVAVIRYVAVYFVRIVTAIPSKRCIATV